MYRHNTFLFPGLCRPEPTQPISQVLSSQVTNETGTSTDTAIQLTFRYSDNVSSIMYTTTYNLCNYNINFMYRLMFHN